MKDHLALILTAFISWSIVVHLAWLELARIFGL